MHARNFTHRISHFPNYIGAIFYLQTSESKHNLDDFISMDASVGVGDVVSLKEFVQMFHRRS